MTENITNKSAFSINKNTKQKTVKGLTAGALALGVFAVASFSAWTASQTFTVDASVADSASASLEYSLDAGTTWVAFSGTAAEIELATADDLKRMTPGDERDFSVMVRNTSTTNAMVESVTTPHSFTATGDMYEGLTPVTVTEDAVNVMPSTIKKSETKTIGFTVAAPSDLPETYSGATGVITVELNFDASSDATA